MKEYHGRFIFDELDIKAGTHPAIQALKGVNFGDVHLPYGFTLDTVKGKTRVVPRDKCAYWLEVNEVNSYGEVIILDSCHAHTAGRPPKCASECNFGSSRICKTVCNGRDWYRGCARQ